MDKPTARSLYRGVRATLTMDDSGERILLNLSVKGRLQRWDEWDLLIPAKRVAGQEITSSRDAVRFLVEALEGLLTDTDGLP